MFYKLFMMCFICLLFFRCSNKIITENSNLNKEVDSYDFSGYKLMLPIEFKQQLYGWTDPVKDFFPKKKKRFYC